MTNKVRVLREIPFMNVGDIITVTENYMNGNKYFMVSGLTIHENRFPELFDDGFLEWVEEPINTFIQTSGKCLKCGQEVEEPKSLEEKFYESKRIAYKQTVTDYIPIYAQIATDHFKEKFDEAVGGFTCGKYHDFEQVRKALFGDK